MTYIDAIIKKYNLIYGWFKDYDYIDNKFLYSNPKDYELCYDKGYNYKDKEDYVIFRNMRWHHYIFNRNNLPVNNNYYISHCLGLNLSDGDVLEREKGYYKFLKAAKPLIEYNKNVYKNNRL